MPPTLYINSFLNFMFSKKFKQILSFFLEKRLYKPSITSKVMNRQTDKVSYIENALSLSVFPMLRCNTNLHKKFLV